jgi:hypothetical protein
MENKLFQIKSRFTGNVLFELQCKSLKSCVEAAVSVGANLYGADLPRANLSGANLSRSDLSGADLSRSDLSRANLSRSDLSGADLYRANLSRSDLSGAYLFGANREKTTIQNTPLQILGLRWDIIIFDKDMRIGCEYHSIKDWWSFDDDRISDMDSDALAFWTTNKAMLQAICAADGRA